MFVDQCYSCQTPSIDITYKYDMSNLGHCNLPLRTLFTFTNDLSLKLLLHFCSNPRDPFAVHPYQRHVHATL